MEKETGRLEKRVKENIVNYTMRMLLGEKELEVFLDSMADILDADIILTGREGNVVVQSAGADHGIIDDKGRVLIIQGRTVGQLYAVKRTKEPFTPKEEALLDATKELLRKLGRQTFLYKETTLYIDEKENNQDTGKALYHLEKEDGLTGVFNKFSFEERLQVIDRSQTVPVALLYANINDWKFVNDNYGDDESDRLIQVIAGILKQEAKEDYVIGRVDGDVFQVLILLAEEGEAEEYKRRVQAACLAFEDDYLAPAVAIGIQYKTNVEESLTEKVSDAEYEMFQDKFDLKNAPGYQERLRKGLGLPKREE